MNIPQQLLERAAYLIARSRHPEEQPEDQWDRLVLTWLLEFHDLLASSPSERLGGQPPCETEERVITKIRQRREAGRSKYGTTMDRTDLTRALWLKHAQEEALDLSIYLERILAEENKPKSEVCKHAKTKMHSDPSGDQNFYECQDCGQEVKP